MNRTERMLQSVLRHRLNVDQEYNDLGIFHSTETREGPSGNGQKIYFFREGCMINSYTAQEVFDALTEKKKKPSFPYY